MCSAWVGKTIAPCSSTSHSIWTSFLNSPYECTPKIWHTKQSSTANLPPVYCSTRSCPPLAEFHCFGSSLHLVATIGMLGKGSTTIAVEKAIVLVSLCFFSLLDIATSKAYQLYKLDDPIAVRPSYKNMTFPHGQIAPSTWFPPPISTATASLYVIAKLGPPVPPTLHSPHGDFSPSPLQISSQQPANPPTQTPPRHTCYVPSRLPSTSAPLTISICIRDISVRPMHIFSPRADPEN